LKRKITSIFVILLLIPIFTSMSSGVPIKPLNEENSYNSVYYQQLFFSNSPSNPIYDGIVELIQQLNETMYLGYLENITSFGPRYTGTPACQQAGDYIYNELKSMGLEVRYHDWDYEGYQDRNIEGTLHGTNESSDEIYIICAHHDTVANCPGADDDASGVATVLAAADILSQHDFNHTIRFVTFSGEEQWMLGSHEYAQEAYENGDNIIAVLNVDMIGFAITSNHGNNIKVYYDQYSMWLTTFTESIVEQYYDYINLDIIPSGYSYSDQYYFWEYGYNGLFYHEYEFNYYYHTPQDNIENFNITYATKCSKLVLAVLVELAQLGVNNSAPYAPTISGPTSGKAGTEYIFTFNSVDPDQNNVYYYILWDDGHTEVWDGPHASGADADFTHTYTKEGTYTINAKAKDKYDAESNTNVFNITITKKSKPVTNPDIFRFIDTYQILLNGLVKLFGLI